MALLTSAPRNNTYNQMINITSIGLVAAGGAIGAIARFITVEAVSRIIGKDFPYGTLLVNILGSFLMGMLFMVFLRYFFNTEEHTYNTHNIWLFLTVGVLGGFTTFSSFSLDVFSIMQRGEILTAIIYILSSVLLSIGGLFLGALLIKML